MAAFAPFDLSQSHGIRLTFDDTPTGAIYVAHFRASRNGARSLPGLSASVAASSGGGTGAQTFSEGNAVEGVRLVSAAGAGGSDNAVLQFTLTTQRAVMVSDELLQMAVGDVPCDGGYADSSLRRLNFVCPTGLAEGAPIRVGNNARMAWNFGAFSNNMVR
jgi:hypothetical protein